MDCKKCVYCIREDKNTIQMKCKKFQGMINVPCYCIYYTTKKQYLKEQTKKIK